MQSWELDRKIRVSQTRIIEWLLHFNDQVYVGFSGGIDSTVLLDMVRRIDNSVKAVFCNTGLEYPEIIQFVRKIDNVVWLKPKMSFPKVIEKYGYPVISKEQSAFIQEYRDTKSEKLKDIRWNGNKYGRGKISKKYRFLVPSQIPISDKCCDIMKKEPSKRFEKETGLHPILGTTTEESAQRKSNWLMYGCNAFEKDRPTSQPLSFWTKQDTLQYLIKNHDEMLDAIKNNLIEKGWKQEDIEQIKHPWSEVYGEIVEENGILKCTGEPRTGCYPCMYGVHLEKEPNKFQRIRVSHPKIHDYCIRNTRVFDNETGEEIAFVSNSEVFGITKWSNQEINEWIDQHKEQDELFYEHYKVISGLGMGDVLDYIGVKY